MFLGLSVCKRHTFWSMRFEQKKTNELFPKPILLT